eukprot:CAMPEP_0201529764 /NCGR_PEP_ID=MMETSP0161_2-20130828/42728_1 /ASSEMBLY_ACC=CAM_ASM_000251 /TAXON_ID=180227 /ORGANISM="Neoparamoeba aestuarina, Strain SoJaBio B1-5/56/2" /LENGTH=200 /DNA_ID=CAMNT_0047931737 /DNA_START=110 /DNA_END=709 /DNA_ORIENTATION=-
MENAIEARLKKVGESQESPARKCAFPIAGGVYDGLWVDGLPNGKGKYITPLMSFEGDFRNGSLRGRGTAKFTTGASYTGEWVNGAMDGQGIYVNVTGDKYVGSFKRDRYHGNGKMEYKNGDLYVGKFLNSMAHGKGRLEFKKGDYFCIFDGHFEEGLYHGEGTLKAYLNWSKEREAGILAWIYTGDWKFGKKHGKGTLKK